MPNWLFFVLGTILCWGAYGPVIHEGQMDLKSPWKAILCVGAAYFVLAVIIPIALLSRETDPFQFTLRGTLFASLGGALGALGAIFIVGALRSGGLPAYVMPLVFAGAPLVSVVVASLIHPPQDAPSPFLYLGYLLAVAGGGMVLYFKP